MIGKFHELQKLPVYFLFFSIWRLSDYWAIATAAGRSRVPKTPHLLQLGFEKITLLPIYILPYFDSSKNLEEPIFVKLWF